jgi:hypothetical protein
MRLAGTVLVVVVWLCSLAAARPKQAPRPATRPAAGAPAVPKPGKQATPQQQAELQRLDQELTQHQVKQATFAALKVARQLYELQRKATGEDSPEAQRRKQTLAGLMQQTGDYAGAERLFTELLHTAEKLHGPQSREALYALMPMSGVYSIRSCSACSR